MRPPGRRLPAVWLLRLLSHLFCTPREQLVLHETVADLQHEYVSADPARNPWRACFAASRGYLALARVACRLSFRAIGGETVRPSFRRLVTSSGIAIIAFTVLLILLPGSQLEWSEEPRALLRLMALLIPSTIAMSVPLGILFGTATSVARAATRGETAPARGTVFLAASVFALNLVVAGWLMPQTNQAWREERYRLVLARSSERTGITPGSARRIQVAVPPGPNELSLASLRSEMARTDLSPFERDATAVAWHYRISMILVSLLVAPLGVGLGRAVRGRLVLALCGCAVVAIAWYNLLHLGAYGIRAASVAPSLGILIPTLPTALLAFFLIRGLRVPRTAPGTS